MELGETRRAAGGACRWRTDFRWHHKREILQQGKRPERPGEI